MFRFIRSQFVDIIIQKTFNQNRPCCNNILYYLNIIYINVFLLTHNFGFILFG